MKRDNDISKRYSPVQPTIETSAEPIKYQELFPDIHLRKYIYCYWQLETSAVLSKEFNYSVVADGCIDIFFELHNPTENFLMGLCKEFTEFPLGTTFHYIGIRFLPAAFAYLFRINVSELSDRVEALNDVIPDTALFIEENISSKNTPEEIATIFNHYFLALVSKNPLEIDSRLLTALDLIFKKSGVIDIEKDLDIGLSPRQLRRLFEFYIGDSAKTFSQIIRFQSILSFKSSSAKLISKDKIYFDAGYFDQAHFIKDFKKFYGVTPGKIFRH